MLSAKVTLRLLAVARELSGGIEERERQNFVELIRCAIGQYNRMVAAAVKASSTESDDHRAPNLP